MKNRLILSLVFSLLLVGCANPSQQITTDPSTEESFSSVEVSTDQETTSIESESTIDQPGSNPDETSIEEVSTEETTTQTSLPSEESTTQEVTSEDITDQKTEVSTASSTSSDSIPARGESLPIGNKSVSGPSNTTPVDISEWTNFDFTSSIPGYWSYIQGNNKVKNCSDFYAESAGGGFKFAKLYYGLQSPLINSWPKIEVRLHISKVANNSQKKDVDEPILHIYGYNSDGYHIYTDYIEQGSITAQKEGTELKFYIKNENVSYFELRLNAHPYKGSQCYNFGVDEISLKGWQWE